MRSTISLRSIGLLLAVSLIWSCAERIYLPITWFIPPSAHNDYSPKASFRNEIYGGIIGAQYKGETGFMVGLQSGVHATGKLIRGGFWLSAWHGKYFYLDDWERWGKVPGGQIQGLFAIAPKIHENGERFGRIEFGLWGGIGIEGMEKFYNFYDPATGTRTVKSEFYFLPVPTGGISLGYQLVNSTNWAFMFRYYIGLGGGLTFSFRHKERIEIGLSTQILAFTTKPDMPPARLSISWWIN
ncbi:MAG: hypothetical protein GXO48_08870 [Chlorobi bacterium]|nr:hypothetical protein [Chlorobiota bacterium]